MQVNKQKVYIGFTIVALGLICIALFNRATPLKAHTKQKTAITTLFGVDAIELDEVGGLNRQLTTPKLVYHQDTLKKQLKTPVIYLTRNKQPWIIQADSATSNKDDSEIQLQGHVKISQYNNQHQLISQLKTELLNYYPKTQKVATNQDIIYLSQGLTIHSKGLKADLNNDTMELVSNARGTYVPNKKT